MRDDSDGSHAGGGSPLVLRLGERVPPLVSDVFEAKGYTEYDEDSPPEGQIGWHVYWKAGRFKPSEYSEANAVQRVNHFPKTTGITKKDCLLRNLRRMRAIHGNVFNFFPESYILPTEYPTLVRKCASMPPDEKPIWILKPTDSSQGRKIFIIRDLSEISYGHFSASMTAELCDDRPPPDPMRDPRLDDKGRAIATELDMSTTLKMLKARLHKTVTPCVKFTEMHIVQRYIHRPLCFHGYKLDLRIYVLLLSAQPLRLYWYRDCLVRFATQKYDMSDLENSYAHLTNTSINKNSASYSTVKEGIKAGCKWSLHQFLREHPDHALASPLLWERIKAIISLTMLSIAASVPDNGGCFELLGYDVMIDEMLRPWLLEVNCSPALGVECAADREVKEPLLADLCDVLALQRGSTGTASLPAGGGARAAKARGWPGASSSRASGGGAASSSSDEGSTRTSKRAGSEEAFARVLFARREAMAAAERVANVPSAVGGYELIFPFNALTTKLAESIGGNEAVAVTEIRTELQRQQAAAGTEEETVGDGGSSGSAAGGSVGATGSGSGSFADGSLRAGGRGEGARGARCGGSTDRSGGGSGRSSGGGAEVRSTGEGAPSSFRVGINAIVRRGAARTAEANLPTLASSRERSRERSRSTSNELSGLRAV